MRKKILNRKTTTPLVPVYTGENKEEKIRFQLFKYKPEEYFEDAEYSEDAIQNIPFEEYKYWLNIHGIHDIKKITNICNKLTIHPLTIQDILDINQRSKFQEYDNYWFFSIKSILPFYGDNLQTEQLSFVLGENYLISFQEKKADYFDHVRERIRGKIGKIRDRGTDYLLYVLFESILDNYTKTISNIEIRSENLGRLDITSDPSPHTLELIETLKRQTHLVRKNIVPIKEFVSKLERKELGLVQQDNFKYYYDIRDLCLSLIDDCDQIDVKLDSNTNLFFSIQGHRMNQVMKTLTVVSSIFIPLTFIAGIYGMNFNNMPELNWEWGYVCIWGIMLSIFGSLLIYFRKKKWY